MDDALVLPGRHKIDVDDYYRMGEAGILHEGLRVELIDGEVIDMVPIGQPHTTAVDKLNEALVLASQGRAIVSVQNPVRLDRFNEPQPDFTILRRRADFYGTGERAGPADVLLLVEVADTSLYYDRTVKLRLYASRGIGEYWIVDVNRRVLLAHRRPTADGFGELATYGPGDTLRLAMAPEIVLSLDALFG